VTTHSSTLIWILISVAALGSWLIRLSFIAVLGREATISELTMRFLGLIPAAVLAAIVAPSLTHATGSFDLGTDRFVAGIVAAVVAWRSNNVLATIGAGMGVLWSLQVVGWGS